MINGYGCGWMLLDDGGWFQQGESRLRLMAMAVELLGVGWWVSRTYKENPMLKFYGFFLGKTSLVNKFPKIFRGTKLCFKKHVPQEKLDKRKR